MKLKERNFESNPEGKNVNLSRLRIKGKKKESRKCNKRKEKQGIFLQEMKIKENE